MIDTSILILAGCCIALACTNACRNRHNIVINVLPHQIQPQAEPPTPQGPPQRTTPLLEDAPSIVPPKTPPPTEAIAGPPSLCFLQELKERQKQLKISDEKK